MVTADGASECVPSVVTDAIDWAPRSWMADGDDVAGIAMTGRHLIGDEQAGTEGFRALQEHNRLGVLAWLEWLNA